MTGGLPASGHVNDSELTADAATNHLGECDLLYSKKSKRKWGGPHGF
jgi:hypothetical protein